MSELKDFQAADVARPVKGTKVYAFLAAIAVMPNVVRAAKAAGISRSVHYRRYKTDPVYQRLFDEAWEMGIAAMEDKGWEYAVEGYREPVIYKGCLTYPEGHDEETGKPIGEPLCIPRPNPSMHQFMLRGARPEKYRERYEHTGKGGGPIEGTIKVVFVKPDDAGSAG